MASAADYSTCDSTGGAPPHMCWAPTKAGTQAARLSQKMIDNIGATTGFRPASECRAPVRKEKSRSRLAGAQPTPAFDE